MKRLGVVVLMTVIGLAGCRTQPSAEERHHDANTPAGKLGQAAHEVAKDAGKAARVVGKELGRAAHDAKAGWNEASERDKAKKGRD